MAGHAVDGSEFARSVEVPNHAAVGCGIRTQMSVEGSGKDGTRDHRDGCRLRRTATFTRVGTCRRFDAPQLLSIRESESNQSATSFWAHLAILTELGVGDRNVNVLLVCCRAPLDSTDNAPLSCAGLPQDLTFTLRVQRVNDARFLARHKSALSVWQTNEDGR